MFTVIYMYVLSIKTFNCIRLKLLLKWTDKSHCRETIVYLRKERLR